MELRALPAEKQELWDLNRSVGEQLGFVDAEERVDETGFDAAARGKSGAKRS